jgi:hypothetical protein
MIHAKEEEAASVVRGLEWEMLLAMSSLGNLTLDNDDDDLEEGIEVAALGMEAAASGQEQRQRGGVMTRELGGDDDGRSRAWWRWE